MANFKEAFGANVKMIRKSKGITQEKLSEMIDIHPRQMSKIENGEHFPSAKSLEKICISLGVSPRVLFDFKIDDFDTDSSNKNISLLINSIAKIAKNDSQTEFIKLAADALSNKKSLNELYLVIKGMLLAKNNYFLYKSFEGL